MTRSVEIEVAAREGHGRAVDDEVVPSVPAMRLMAPSTRSKIGSVSSFCFFSSSLLYSTNVFWSSTICFCQSSTFFWSALLREHLRLLVDVLLLLAELLLALVQLLLAAVEELLQRRLGAQAVLRLHDGALHVDDGDLHRLRGGGRAEERDDDRERRRRARRRAVRRMVRTAYSRPAVESREPRSLAVTEALQAPSRPPPGP